MISIRVDGVKLSFDRFAKTNNANSPFVPVIHQTISSLHNDSYHALLLSMLIHGYRTLITKKKNKEKRSHFCHIVHPEDAYAHDIGLLTYKSIKRERIKNELQNQVR
jgi:hypothetical protein